MSAKTLRLILGDQLDVEHSWFKHKDQTVTYLVAELHQETRYVKHHIQKLLAFFAAMQEFAEALADAGHQVIYLTLDDTQSDESLPSLIKRLCGENQFTRFEYQRPDEFRLLQQLASFEPDNIEVACCDTEHFLVPFEEIEQYFLAGRKQRMEHFYRKLRKRFDLLMQGGEPLGGEWNFDSANRNKLKKADLQDIPPPLLFDNRVAALKRRIEKHQVPCFGHSEDQLYWPTSRRQAQQLLEYFCQHGLTKFGKFQDAMTVNSPHSWSLYHSRLSFALNSKLIKPMTVINRAIKEFKARPADISLAQIEGFVRQILGWREFVRGIYWVNMPSYSETNQLQASRDLPNYFWDGETKMNCMKACLGQSLDYAYAHHIQRLMVIGNFCLLAGIDPDQVDAWYLGVYVDAIEWVEMPNTRGMCQFADGGLVASKPYAASGAYINRMSDYCGDCSYQVKQKVGDDACPFNSLYWQFMQQHRERLGQNPRNAMVYRNLDKMDGELRNATLARGKKLLGDLQRL